MPGETRALHQRQGKAVGMAMLSQLPDSSVEERALTRLPTESDTRDSLDDVSHNRRRDRGREHDLGIGADSLWGSGTHPNMGSVSAPTFQPVGGTPNDVQ